MRFINNLASEKSGLRLESYLQTVERYDFKNIYRANTPRRKVKNSSMSLNLACVASLRELSFFRFRNP